MSGGIYSCTGIYFFKSALCVFFIFFNVFLGFSFAHIVTQESELHGSLTPKNPQSLTGSYFFVIFVYLIDRNAVLCYDTIYMEELP